MSFTDPEQYPLPPTTHVPNSPLPALVYRNVLPTPHDAQSAQELCEGNEWEKRGEWGAITTAHFHPNTHECYAVIRGESRLVLGRQKPTGEEETTDGVEFDVAPGDVIVVPAGVSHRSITSKDDYRYIGVYPKAAPKWRNNFCKGEEPIEALEKEVSSVDIPDQDPVYGLDGPLGTVSFYHYQKAWFVRQLAVHFAPSRFSHDFAPPTTCTDNAIYTSYLPCTKIEIYDPHPAIVNLRAALTSSAEHAHRLLDQ